MSFLLATRGSNLALWQANTTAALLGDGAEPHVVHSSGDQDLVTELAAFGKTGIFTVEIDLVVLNRQARAGVHSLKDMSTTVHEELVLAAVLERGPAEDVLVGSTFEALPEGARVATGSRRREAMLLAERPDLEIVAIRGNVETRLRKIAEGEAAATVMARAGLERLGYGDSIAEVLTIERFVPAPGQGIVGLVCRKDDAEARERLAEINDPAAWCCALAERAFLRELEGGCSAPIGGHAQVSGKEIVLHGRILSPDGSRMLEARDSGPPSEAEALGVQLAQRLAGLGAREMLGEARA